MIPFVMPIYRWILVVTDLIYLLGKSTLIMLESMYRFIKPVEKKSLNGHLALVTGTGHGIGKELAVQLAKHGVRVVCCDINEESNKKTVEGITALGGKAWAYTLDVADQVKVTTVMQKIQTEVGDVDLLINNAGIMICKPIMKHSPDEIKKTFDVNVLAQFWVIRAWLRTFMSRGTGHIVSVSSIVSFMGTPNLVPYTSSKYAVRGLMDGLKEELRHSRRYPNIKFTTVFPFIVNTGLVKNPVIRFPSLTPISSPTDAATAIIDAIQREETYVSVPSKDYILCKLASILPLEVQELCVDYIDTRVDEHDDK